MSSCWICVRAWRRCGMPRLGFCLGWLAQFFTPANDSVIILEIFVFFNWNDNYQVFDVSFKLTHGRSSIYPRTVQARWGSCKFDISDNSVFIWICCNHS